jgi:hypothetical protein
MLKLLININCDECGQSFHFARHSEYNTDALSFNLNALSSMLSHYRWERVKNKENLYHYCSDCVANFCVPEENGSPAAS